MSQIVDYNIAKNGEVASPLHRLLQEIETILVSDGDLITMNDSKLNLDRYLFKFGQNTNAISAKIQKVLDDNIINDTGYLIQVDTKFMNGLHNKDTLLIEVSIILNGALKEKLTYAVTP